MPSSFPASVKFVGSFQELLSTPFLGEVNALCWPRELSGNFDEIAAVVGPLDEITTVDEESLRALDLSPAGELARKRLLDDLTLLRGAGLDPSIDLIPAYPRDPYSGPVPLDVYDFHVDSATVVADTWLCSYTVACSEGLANADALRRVDLPETRATLLKNYGGVDDEGFVRWLNEHCYDLHYCAKPNASPYSFGFGNLWRIATQCAGSAVLPCVHRAPETKPGQPPRLLLIC